MTPRVVTVRVFRFQERDRGETAGGRPARGTPPLSPPSGPRTG